MVVQLILLLLLHIISIRSVSSLIIINRAAATTNNYIVKKRSSVALSLMMAKEKVSVDDKTYRKGIMMILSPTKTLDFSDKYKDHINGIGLTYPECSIEKTTEIVNAMKKMNKTELTKKLKLSANLATSTYKYWNDFQLDHQSVIDESCKKPCVFAYSGAAFQGLQVIECCNNKDTIQYMQNNLRILDAVYGVLRPLDQIQPYRLEMGIKDILPNTPALSKYWSESITRYIVNDLEKGNNDPKILLNLASEEYSCTINVNDLPTGCVYVKVIFWEEGRIVSVHAKRARGLMARYILENQIMSIDDIKQFNLEGYSYIQSKSNETEFVFDRRKQTNKKITTTTGINKRTSNGNQSSNNKARKKR